MRLSPLCGCVRLKSTPYDTLSQPAAITNGRYHYAPTPNEFSRQSLAQCCPICQNNE